MLLKALVGMEVRVDPGDTVEISARSPRTQRLGSVSNAPCWDGYNASSGMHHRHCDLDESFHGHPVHFLSLLSVQISVEIGNLLLSPQLCSIA